MGLLLIGWAQDVRELQARIHVLEMQCTTLQ